MTAPPGAPDATTARKVGRDVADSMAEAWAWAGSNLSPGERAHVADQIRNALGIAPKQRRRKHARWLTETAMRAFNLRMDARQHSLNQRIGAP